MKDLSIALVVLVIVVLIAIASPILSAHSLMQPTTENSALNKIGQIEDNITRPLNYGEEHINNSIDMIEEHASLKGTTMDVAILFYPV